MTIQSTNLHYTKIIPLQSTNIHYTKIIPIFKYFLDISPRYSVDIPWIYDSHCSKLSQMITS
jgi:hypothetical protein